MKIYFVLGTRAQYIKVAPVMREMLDLGMEFRTIYTAQHRENIDEIIAVFNLNQPDFIMYDQGEANTKSSFLRWFVNVLFAIVIKAKSIIPYPGIVLTHGDTFTSWMAALLGKLSGSKVGHIESGFRSYNIFDPFPEELSRLATFYLSDIYFCSDEAAMNNVKKFKGHKVNVGANTMLDGVRYALGKKSVKQFDFQSAPYAMVSIHRYENIFTSRFTELIIPLLLEISKKQRLIFTLHPSTRERLLKLGLYDELISNVENITLHERFDFIDWINICKSAEFVITDGGSNQEELSYLGTPTLLFRDRTERFEGLGKNIVLSSFDEEIINEFIENYKSYQSSSNFQEIYPSKTIVKFINGFEEGDR